MADIKFCGLTRPDDARHAATLGAAYIGVVFADSPRRLSEAQAKIVYAGAPASVRRVAVFGADAPSAIADLAARLGVDVVQLHGDPDPDTVTRLRALWAGAIWAVQRVRGETVPPVAADLFAVADAVVLDTRVDGVGQLGGTGKTLPWERLREPVAALRARSGRARLVLAGGLRPENVTEAVRLLQPDIVDVSSGVETEVGVKDHGRMRAFRDAVHTARFA